MSVNNTVLDELIDALTERMSKSFSKQLNTANVEYAFNGVVTEVNATDNTAVVDIGSSSTDYIPNKTGYDVGTEEASLKVGDSVKVYCDRKNMVGAYIGIKLS